MNNIPPSSGDLEAPLKDSRQRSKNRFRLGWIIVLLILVFCSWKFFSGGTSSKKKHHADLGSSAVIPVTTAIVSTEDFPIYLDGLGTVQAYNSVQVNARVSGLIKEINFQEGQDVKQGDLLAVIDPQTYQAQYDQTVSKQAQDEAQLQSAKVVLDRDQELLNKQVLDKQTYDTQRYLVDQLAAAVKSDAANVEYQKSQLDWTRVTAPISGKTGVRLLDVGNQVMVGGNSQNSSNGSVNPNAIVTINQIQPIFVSFTLPQQDLESIRDAVLARKNPQVIALDRNNQTVLDTGELSVIDNQIDPTTATVKLKAIFQNQEYRLWPGQFVNVRLLVKILPNAVVVPSEAVQLGPDGPYVYVVSAQNKAVMRTVTTGASESGKTLITTGVTPGEKVVIDGQYRLQPDSPVSMASNNVAKFSGTHDHQ